jgi:hypothetical protein
VDKIGECTGHTTPSVIGIDYLGSQDDFALSVMFEDNSQIWASPDQLILVDHNEGLVIEVGNMKATKNADGSWNEEIIESRGDDNTAPQNRNWFTKLFKK